MKNFFSLLICLSLIVSPLPSIAEDDKEYKENTGATYASQIIGISNGIVGSAILMKCKLGTTQLSIPVYMAGGVAYILSEITSGKEKARDVDAQAKKLDEVKATMKEGGDYQKAAIEMQIEDEKSNLRFVDKRIKWFTAISAIYGTAMGLAILEMFLKYPPTFKPDLAGCAPDGVSHLPGSLLVSTAYAALSSSGSIGGMATGMAVSYAVKTFLPKVTLGTKLVDLSIGMLNPAEGRIAFFGAQAGLAMFYVSGLQTKKGAIEKRIKKLEEVKAQINTSNNAIAEGSSTGAGSDPSEKSKIDPAKGQFALTALPKGETPTARTCYSNNGKIAEHSIAACNAPLKIARPQFEPNFELPTLKTGAIMASDFAQSLADGNVGDAELLAGKLGSMAGQINKVNEGLLKKVNEKLASEGKRPIDIDGEIKREVDELNQALEKEKLGSVGSLASNTNSSGAVVSVGKNATESDGLKHESSVTNNSAVFAAEAIDLSKLDNGEAPTTEDSAAETKIASLEESLHQYEQNQSDIAKDPGVSIFKQVSNRYFLNYSKIFNRKEIAPPLAAQETAK